MNSHNLITVRLSSRDQARDLYQQLQEIDIEDDNLKIVDAVAAGKNERGRVDIEQTSDVTGAEGALGGGFVGMVVGVMLAGPVGLAIGALAGGAITGLYTWLRDSGINEREIRSLARELQPGQALLFILYEGEVPGRALEVMRSYNVALVHTQLPEDTRQRIAAALSGVETGALSVPVADEANDV